MSVRHLIFAAVGVAPGFTVWNPSDLANLSLSNGNMTASMLTIGIGGVRSIASKTGGKYYWEITRTSYGGLTNNSSFGVANASAVFTTGLGSANAVTCGGNNGSIYVGASDSGLNIGAVNAQGIVYGIALDVGGMLIWFRNCTNRPTIWNATFASANDPGTGVGGINIAAIISSLVPAFAFCTAYNSGTLDAWTANFGATAFLASAPSGFIGLG